MDHSDSVYLFDLAPRPDVDDAGKQLRVPLKQDPRCVGVSVCVWGGREHRQGSGAGRDMCRQAGRGQAAEAGEQGSLEASNDMVCS